MRVVAVNVGKVRALPVPGHHVDSVPSGILKRSVSTLAHPTPVAVAALGMDGDEQADHTVHGGLDKAVYAYPLEHYPVWETMRRDAIGIHQPLAHGSMGENLTIEGLLETSVYIGDILLFGDSEDALVLRVTAPRSPCFKFNACMGFSHAAKMMVQSAYTGFYLEVVRPGSVRGGQSFAVRAGDRVMRVDEQHQLLMRPSRSARPN